MFCFQSQPKVCSRVKHNPLFSCFVFLGLSGSNYIQIEQTMISESVPRYIIFVYVVKWKTKVHKFSRAVLSDLHHLVHNIHALNKLSKNPV